MFQQSRDVKWKRSLKEKVECSARSRAPAEQATIFKIPEHIRATSPTAYEPKIISIGPYHRNNLNLKPMEEVKLHYLRRALRVNAGTCLDDYLSKLGKLTARARSCYFGDIGMDDDDFLQMLILDGCLIVSLLLMVDDRKLYESEIKEDVILRNRMNALHAMFDLLLLENQIPFFILESLLGLVTSISEEKSSTRILIRMAAHYFRILLPENFSHDLLGETTKFDHLLHLFHSCATFSPCTDPHPYLTFDAFYYGDGTSMPMQTLPCASDLRMAGVTVMISRKNEGKFWDMYLVSCSPAIGVSPVQIDGNSSSFYRNLIAFEQQHNPLSTLKSPVTAYTMLMSCLIKTKEDLDLLERAKVVAYAVSAQDAVLFFNNLCRDAIGHFNQMFMANLSDITDHVWKCYGSMFWRW